MFELLNINKHIANDILLLEICHILLLLLELIHYYYYCHYHSWYGILLLEGCYPVALTMKTDWKYYNKRLNI